ncbi:Threonine/homoserine exporter RhtA [compost metagenome]
MLATEPAIAAIAGMLVLGEHLSPVQWSAIGTIMVAAMGSALTSRPAPARAPAPQKAAGDAQAVV